ncbi:ribosome maturation factor RimM [Thiolapillus sp.]
MTDSRVKRQDSEGDGPDRLVTLGRISGLHGVQGWLKVYSDTRPRENILNYSPWYLRRGREWEEVSLQHGRRQGKLVLAKLEGCNDRETARELMGATIAVRRAQLQEGLAEDEFYWTDLEGLRVVTLEGVELGRVDHLMETGANDVLVVRGERERLLPWIWKQVIRDVDLEQGCITVDWDPEF